MKGHKASVLVTGFEPFDGGMVNPSSELARTLDGKSMDGADVVGRILPCVFDQASRLLLSWIDELEPAVVVCLGLAGGRTGLWVERVAVNVDDARIPDNSGYQPVDRVIIPDGPVAYWTTLPAKAIVARWEERKIPGGVSQSAGTYVCNHVFYTLMHALQNEQRGAWGALGGFIHVPYLPQQSEAQAGQPHLDFESQCQAIEDALHVSLAEALARRRTG